MHAERELTALAVGKAALRQRIARHRRLTVQAAARAVQPLALLDRAVAHWRRLSPLARIVAVPLGFALHRALAPRHRLLGAFLRWSPLVLGAVRGLTGRRTRPVAG